MCRLVLEEEIFSRRALPSVPRTWCVQGRFSIWQGGLHAKDCISQTLFPGICACGGGADVAGGKRCAVGRIISNVADSNSHSYSYTHSAVEPGVNGHRSRERGELDR